MSQRIDTVYDFSERGLVELKAWLEPWFLDQPDVISVAAEAISFPAAVAALAATRDLRGWWRLGEGASPYADTSGHANGPADATKQTAGTAMTMSITGALPVADDDGAVQFNNTSGGDGDWLDADDPGVDRLNFDSAHPEMTVAAWVNPTASASTFNGVAIGNWADGGSGNCGWRLGIAWPARTPFFHRRENGGPGDTQVTGAALAAAEWAFIVGTYDATYGHRLYVNGALVDTDPAEFTGLPGFGVGPTMGRNGSGSAPSDNFCGGVDEVSVWGVALTPAEIASLYASGTGTTPGGVDSLAVYSDTPLTGDITLSEGSNVALTRVGQDIEIAATAGILPTLLDAKGDLIAATAADTAARLPVGSNDQVLTADSAASTGLRWATLSTGSGGVTEIAYVEFTSPVTVTSTSEGSPTDIVSSGAVTYAAVRVCIEFWCPGIGMSNNGYLILSLWDGGTQIGQWGEINWGSTTMTGGWPTYLVRFLTPSAASHTYKVRAFSNIATNSVYAGAGGSGQRAKGFIRVTIA